MVYYYNPRRRSSSIFDSFTLHPLPYPVLLLLAVISIFLGISWYFSYESMVEEAEEQFNWVLLFIPVLLLLVAQWLSSMKSPDMFFGSTPCEKRRRTHRRPAEGSSPWLVAAFILLLLILVQYQSTFLDMWF